MSFVDDIDAAVKVFGTRDVGLIWGLGMANWKDDGERDAFLEASKRSLDISG
jgi:ribosome biogenesis protein Nip4